MPRNVPWLAAVIWAGWLTSSASAFHPLAGLRHNDCANCTTAPVVTPAPAVVASDMSASTKCGNVGCRGNELGLSDHLLSFARKGNQWMLNVPRKQPPPPKPLAINPYTRSPRDFFLDP